MTTLKRALASLNARLSRHALAAGLIFALPLSALTWAYNLFVGPLYNLNDIGTWRLRLLFVTLCAAAHFALLAATALLYHENAARLALRQLTVTAGFVILLLGINQRTYLYAQTVRPLIRAAQEGGLAALTGMKTNLSVPALTLLCAATGGPIYDMYLAKLLAIFCDVLLALCAARAADGMKLGLRAEAALALCLILPQGFMNAACCAAIDHAAALALAASLALCAGIVGKRPRPLAGMLLWGLAFALNGAALYALPVYALLSRRCGVKGGHLAAGVALALGCCLPAILAGMPAGEAIFSLLRANVGLPDYAAGAPGLHSLFPRAAVEEMPGWALLSKLPSLDFETNATEYYTQAHLQIAMRGLSVLGLALLLGAWALALRDRGMSALRRALALTLATLFVCPGVTSGAWLAADMLCVLALLKEPELRVSACLSLFATAGTSVLPLTGEALLPAVAALGLELLALLTLLGVIPLGKEARRG